MKHIEIEQDIETVADEFHYSSSTTKFQFEIGTFEHHQVEIAAGEFHPIELMLDGEKSSAITLEKHG
jgi:hypothetical protein